MMIGVYWAWKRYGVIVDFRTIGKIAFASLLATLTTFIFLNMFNAAAWIMLVVGAGIFLMTYLISAPLIGVVDQIDVTNLRVMFSGLGIISKMLEIPLIIMAKIIKWAFKKV